MQNNGINMKISDELKQRIIEAAEARYQNVSAWLRDTALERLEREKPAPVPVTDDAEV